MKLTTLVFDEKKIFYQGWKKYSESRRTFTQVLIFIESFLVQIYFFAASVPAAEAR